jgi:predicted RNase H-like HicB family nuclease
VLLKYISSAMKKAKYEILKEDNTYYGEIPGFKGVYANSSSLEKCKEELEEVLEEWLFYRISRNLPIPIVDGIESRNPHIQYL